MSIIIPHTITIDLAWHGVDDATALSWTSDDGQADLDGGAIDQSLSLETQAIAFADDLLRQGHDGTGRIHLV